MFAAGIIVAMIASTGMFVALDKCDKSGENDLAWD